MRSFREIRFRLRQEAANVFLLAYPPALSAKTVLPADLSILPAPESFLPRLAGSAYARSIVDLAESICARRFPLLGHVVETGAEIRWRRDYVNHIESGIEYFRRIRYLEVEKAGDHKVVWELNRHQHLIVLAQAWRMAGRREFLEEIPRQIESWWEQNPFARGVNWASALEAAFRALSWIWVYHLCGIDLPAAFRRKLAEGIFSHGVYLENNLSIYFSPNTHLLGEAVALHAIGVLFPGLPRAERWRSLGGGIVTAEMNRQVRGDGSHFEQSSAYHVYALDFFLFHALLATVDGHYRDKLRKMADYLAALSSADGSIPLLGDDDGGNLFHPFGNQRRYAARTLASCCAFFESGDWPYRIEDAAFVAAWWMGARAFGQLPNCEKKTGGSFFSEAGVAAIAHGRTHIVVDTRGFGYGSAGHSHAHALSVVCRSGERDVLLDPGTYTYTSEPEWRARFRSTAFHNTVRIDGLNQAMDAGPFRWTEKPSTEAIRWRPGNDWCYLHAGCSYRTFRHERHFVCIRNSEALVIVDVVRGANRHRIEQFWHCGENVAAVSPGVWRVGDSAVLAVPPSSRTRIETGWQSEVPGQKTERPVIVIERDQELPVTLGAVLFLHSPGEVSVSVETHGDRIALQTGTGRSIEFWESREPVVRW